MHADITGQGPDSLLFIHGFGGCGDLWARQREYFQGTARVIAVDLPGHGRTPWNGETLGQMAEGVGRVIAQAGIAGDVVLVGNSFGGSVALELWKQRPALFRSISFVGSMPRFTATDDFPAGLNNERISKLSTQLEGDVAVVLDMFFRSLFTPQERAGGAFPVIKQLRKDAAVPSREALNAWLAMLGAVDQREILRSVDIPVQFIFGDGDHICPMPVVASLKAMLPSARFDVMHGCGHFPFVSRPDEFNRILKGFAL